MMTREMVIYINKNCSSCMSKYIHVVVVIKLIKNNFFIATVHQAF